MSVIAVSVAVLTKGWVQRYHETPHHRVCVGALDISASSENPARSNMSESVSVGTLHDLLVRHLTSIPIEITDANNIDLRMSERIDLSFANN